MIHAFTARLMLYYRKLVMQLLNLNRFNLHNIS